MLVQQVKSPDGYEPRAREWPGSSSGSDRTQRVACPGTGLCRKDVSFTIAQASVMGLVGESGCGKSTVALALLAYSRPGLRITAGSVRIGTTEVLSLSESDLQHVRGRLVSYVPQDPASSLNPAHRVGPQLREALLVHRDALNDPGNLDDRVLELLKEVHLPATKALLRSHPHQLSGGQQQRIAIAMAFACRPSLIVLDEPTTGLDVTTQRHVLETVSSLTENYGLAALYVSHDLPVIGQVAQRTAVMYAGRIVEEGSTARLFGAPRHPYTSGLLTRRRLRTALRLWSEYRATRQLLDDGPKGVPFFDRCPRREADCRDIPPAAQCARRRTHGAVCPPPCERQGRSDLRRGHASAKTAGKTW